jgi:hypothetical protein
MNKMIVAATIACAMFSASIACAQDMKSKTVKQSLKTEQPTETTKKPDSKIKASEKVRPAELKSAEMATPAPQQAVQPKKMTEAKK